MMRTGGLTRVLVFSKIPQMTEILQQQASKLFPQRKFQFIELKDQQDTLQHLLVPEFEEINNNTVQRQHQEKQEEEEEEEEDKSPLILLMYPRAIETETWKSIILQMQKQPQKQQRLKWIMSEWAGLDGLFQTLKPLDTSVLKSIHLTKMGHFGPHMSEYCVQHMLNHERKFHNLILENQKQSQWTDNELCWYRPLSSLTIGIMGYGDIGQYLAKFFKQAFHCKRVHVLKNRRISSIQALDQDGSNHHHYYYDAMYYSSQDGGGQLEQFLSSGLDYLINTMPSTQETRGLLNKVDNNDSKDVLLPILQNCQVSKPVLINVGRGDLISEDSLIEALDQGWLSGAVLDVFEKEPLPKDSALWTRRDVVITPHISAISYANDVARIFFENWELFDKGEFERGNAKFSADWSHGY